MDVKKIPEQEQKKISSSMMESYFKQLKNIYVDLEMCYDFKLGALLQLIKTEVEYDYIFSKLDKYEEAVDLEITKYFPALKFQESDIDRVLNDPSMQEKLSCISPMYTLWYDFVSLITAINTFNSSKTTNDPVTIHFNCNLIKFHNKGKEIIRRFLSEADTTYRVEFYQEDPTNLSRSFMSNMDYFIIYDIVKFFQKGSIGAKMGEELSLLSKPIHTFPRSEQTDNLRKRLMNQKICMIHVCDFDFIEKKLVREE